MLYLVEVSVRNGSKLSVVCSISKGDLPAVPFFVLSRGEIGLPIGLFCCFPGLLEPESSALPLDPVAFGLRPPVVVSFLSDLPRVSGVLRENDLREEDLCEDVFCEG